MPIKNSHTALTISPYAGVEVTEKCSSHNYQSSTRVDFNSYSLLGRGLLSLVAFLENGIKLWEHTGHTNHNITLCNYYNYAIVLYYPW